MQSTGIVRRIDDIGRVVIPKEIRQTMGIQVGDPLEIFINTDGEVIFKKYFGYDSQKERIKNTCAALQMMCNAVDGMDKDIIEKLEELRDMIED